MFAFFAALTAAISECAAISNYTVGINTSAWTGQTGTLAFDLTGGDALAANNMLTISGLFTDGTLPNATGFAMTDTVFFNETLRNLTIGTFLNFSFELTENNLAPGVDQFSFFLLNSASLPIGSTTDPTFADALFAIDITGASGGDLAVFGSLIPNASWQVTRVQATSVPETGSAAVLLFVGLGVLGAMRTVTGKRQKVSG